MGKTLESDSVNIYCGCLAWCSRQGFWRKLLLSGVFGIFFSAVIARFLFKVPNQNICFSREQAHECLDGERSRGQCWQGFVSLNEGSSQGTGGCCWGRHLHSDMTSPCWVLTSRGQLQPFFAAFCSSEQWRGCASSWSVRRGQGGGLGALGEPMHGEKALLSLSLPRAGSTQHLWHDAAIPDPGRVGMRDLPSSELSLLCLSKH